MNHITTALVNHWLAIGCVVLVALCIGGIALLVGLERAQYKEAHKTAWKNTGQPPSWMK